MKLNGAVPQFDRDLRPNESFSFPVHAEDVGDRNDPERCILARCAKRTMRTDNAWFGRSRAYLQIGDDIVRCGYDTKTKRAIGGFDDGAEMAPDVYRCVPLPASETGRGKQEKNARHRSATRKYTKSAKWQAANGKGKRGTWHAPRGWGRGMTPNGDAI